MSVFGAYSKYYNLLYKDKDYAGEVRYVHDLIQKHAPASISVLDLGCGTGRHDYELAKYGYEITGVDLSEEMLVSARSRFACLNAQVSSLTFLPGDIRTVRLNQTFDVVVSLFHVMSYQITNEDLQSAFATAWTHLKPGGVFIFDFWYGPAVLIDRPVVRVKRLEDDEVSVIRIAEPELHFNENVVDVNYEVQITDKTTGNMEQLRETHRMRYLFMPEIEYFLSKVGFKMMQSLQWLNIEREPEPTNWNACCVVVRE
jgi:SAM-dependent methyltransferase